jgi:hypothetical protein
MVKLFFISVLIVVSMALIIEDDFFILSTLYLTDNLLRLSYSQQGQETVREQEIFSNESAQDKPSAAAINKTVQGTLIVTTKVNNEGGGSSKPSDFTIKVHGNNPSISSLPGNSSGAAVKLDMGMYSVTESGPPHYNSNSSMDCSGAVMSAETIKCEITNTYVKPIANNN